jgi:hypothetical protein
MSFIDTIVSGAKAVFGGSSIGSSLARTALLAYAVNRMTSSVNADNQTGNIAASPAPDKGVRLQVSPDPEHKIPIVYGSAYLGAIISDAVSSNNGYTMTYCFTICEKTGIKMSDSVQSEFTFMDIYINGTRTIFYPDGITVNYCVDNDGNRDYSGDNGIKIWCYNGNSSSPVIPYGYTNGTLPAAYTVMPRWTMNHNMSDLIFAIVQVTYDSSKGLTSVPTLSFHVTNSMCQPGDCINDYLKSSRYGCGITTTEINQ